MAIKAQRHEDLLRSSFLPSDVLGGTSLGLFYNTDTEQYLVRTRFQTHYVTKMDQDQGRALGKAIEVFEDMIAGVMPRQKRTSSNTFASLEQRVARLEREASSPALKVLNKAIEDLVGTKATLTKDSLRVPHSITNFTIFSLSGVDIMDDIKAGRPVTFDYRPLKPYSYIITEHPWGLLVKEAVRGKKAGFEISGYIQGQINDMLGEEPMLSKTESRGGIDMIEATLEDDSVHYFICDRLNVLKHFKSAQRAYKDFKSMR